MSGEMGSGRLSALRGWASGSGNFPSYEHVVELLADRDCHYSRAEEAEAEAAQLLADLAETRTELAELREMERERNMYRHAFDRLANNVMDAILPSEGAKEVESLIKSCEAHLDRLRRKASLASKVCEFVREYERRAK